MDGDGTIHMVWEDKRGGSVKKLYYANSSDGGTTFSSNRRVDDSGSQSVNHYEPTIVATGTKKVYVAWKDDRNGDSDIYFSKWGLASQMGYPPELINGYISKEVAGPGTQFTYYVTYKDSDNNPPATGFPRVYIYTNHLKTEQLPNSPFEMQKKLGQDDLFTNGMIYTYKKTL